jgi:RHS repeat-associated protein
MALWASPLVGLLPANAAPAIEPVVQDADAMPDVASALPIAQAFNHRVQVSGLDDASSTTFVNADGTLTTESHAGPIRVQRDSVWRPIDTRLHAAGGKIVPGAVPADVQLSAGGSGPLVVASGSGGTFGYGWQGSLPTPVLSDSTAVYPQVRKGVDLVVDVTRSGFEVSYRLTERPTTPLEFRLPLVTKGVQVRRRGDSGMDVSDSLGQRIAVADAPMMFDASVDPHTGDPRRWAPVTSELATTGSAPALILRPDPTFLADPLLQYPVTIDPPATLTDSADTWVESDYSSSQYSSTELRLGTYNSGPAVARSYLKFSTTAVTGKHVLSADLKLYEFHSYSCTPEYVNVYRLGAAFSSTTTWTNKPANGTYVTQKAFAHGYSSTCNDAWETIPITSLVQGWAAATYPNYGITLAAASETNNLYWKKFNSANASTGDPYISSTYNSYPNTTGVPYISPRTGTASPYWTTTKTPTCKVTVTDADGPLYGSFYIYDGTTLVWSGNSAAPAVASGGTASLAVPAGKLVDNKVYTLKAKGWDGTDQSKSYSTSITFKVDSTAPSATTVSSANFPVNVWTDGRSSGTFSFAATDTNFDHYVYGLDTPTPTTALAAGTSSVSLSGVTDGWHHLYARGVDKAGNLGAVANYAFGAGGVPGSPSSVTGTRGDGQVALAWSAADPNGSPVTNYVVKTYVDGTAVDTRSVGAVTSTTITGLVNGTTYTFGVAATNAVGTGAERLSAAVNPAGPPSIPLGVRAAPRDGQVLVRWTPSNPNGYPVTGYTVSAYVNGTSVANVAVGAVDTAVILGLTNGTAYTFKVTATNAAGTSALSAASTATTPGPGSWSLEGGQALGSDPNAGFWDDVNPGLGSFTTSGADASVSTLGLSLDVTRGYNSFDMSDAGFGIGWTSNANMSWQADAAGNVVVLYPDGRRETHTRNSNGSYSPPSGYAAKLVSNGSEFVLTQTDGTRYTFDANRKVTAVTDPAGHSESLSYDAAGRLATVTSFSGRHLTFTWSNGHVSTVSTDPVNGAALTWTYNYVTVNGVTELASVCDPRGTGADHCTSYDYTDGLLTKITRPRGTTAAIIAYNPDGSVASSDDGLGHVTTFDRSDPAHPAITDPMDNTTQQTVDASLRLTGTLDPDGGTQAFGYDPNGFRNSTTDENLHSTTATFDANGNVLTTTDANTNTAHATYDSANNMLSSCDERSASLTDATYCTTYTYDSNRNRLSETTPGGATRRWTYSSGAEPAVGGGTLPVGLMLSATDARGNVTRYNYTSAGDLAETTTPLGQRTTYAYDPVGRKTSETVYSDSFPAGVTTTWTYDGLGAVLTETGPAVTNAVTGATHQLRTTSVYDKNGNVTSVTQADLVGNDLSRTTTYTYDSLDRQLTSTDNQTGLSASQSYDERGNVVSVTDRLGRVTTTDYDELNRPITVTGPDGSVLQQTTYDPAGQVRTVTDALGHIKQFTYDNAGHVTAVTADPGGVHPVVLERHAYDAAGQVTDDYSGNDLRHVHRTYNANGQVVSSTLDPGGLNRTTSYTYDVDGNTLSTALSDGQRTETTSSTFNAMNDVLSTTVTTGSGSLVTSATFDTRGIQTSITDPRGNVAGANAAAFTTTITADELGRTIRIASPPVSIEVNGGAPTTGRPTSQTGYDTFGDVTQTKDPNGNVTTNSYDRLGRRTGATYPSYTTPAGTTITPTESWTWDAVGNQIGHVDRRGASYTFDFDSSNRVVAAYDPLLPGQANRGVTRTTYDSLGQRLTQVDQNGAATRWTYDALGRPIAQTAAVGQSDGTTIDDTTTFVYDDLGNLTQSTDPTGSVSSATFDAAGEQLTSIDPSGAVTAYGYDVAGRRTSTTDPLGRKTTTTFDLAGRQTAQSRYDRTGVLLTTQSFGYDAFGNQASQTTPRGFATTMTYDGANRLTAVVTPGDHGESISTTAGYDAAGNMTRFTDGRGNSTVRTYTTGNLPAATIEPATTAQPNAADRTWTTTYDAAGQAVREDQPGGVTVTRTFDVMGRLLSESGAGVGVPSASRSFGYDLVGQRTSVSAPGGQDTFTFDDRGLLTAASGPSGSATLGYDAAGRLTDRQDTAGASTFDYDARGLLASATDPITGTTRDLSYDAAGQLTSVAFTGPGGTTSHRDYSYDDLGRVVGDQLVNASGTVTAGYAYGYDLDGDVTSKTVTLPGNAASGTSTYTYDRQGRLKSWVAPGGATTSYGWDAAGNRTQAGSGSFTYDQRNRQLTGPDGTRVWSPTGNLLSITNGAQLTTYAYDGLGRLTGSTAQGQSGTYAYDGLDRLVTSGSSSLTYAGTSIKPVSVGVEQFARSIDDRVVAVDDGVTTSLSGTDLHHDLTYVADPDGSIVGNRAYDPFGIQLARSGSITSTLGYQSDVTDSTTGNVWMGARWYGPAADSFLSEDTVAGSIAEPMSLNRYTYAEGHPLDGYDPDGHSLPPAPDGDLAWYRYLKLKSPYMRGADVQWVQRHLNYQGSGLAEDGIFGPLTDHAVRSFQTRHQPLVTDGIVGPLTWARLKQVMPKLPPAPPPPPPPPPPAVNHRGTHGYCTSANLGKGVLYGTAELCLIKTEDGAQVGISVTAAGSLGITLSQMKSFKPLIDYVKKQAVEIVTKGSANASFTYQRSNAVDFNHMRKWFDFHTESFSIGIPGWVGLSGQHTHFWGTATGDEWGIGISKKGGSIYGAGGSRGKSYSWIYEPSGLLRGGISGAIKTLDVLTWAPRQLL